MNDQQILEYIARTPNCRAQQVADKFDVDLSVASNALKPLVEVGDLTRAAGFAPNGTQAQFYNLSAEFKKSQEGKLILARVDVANQALATAVAAVPAPAVVEVPVFLRADAPAPTKPAALPAARALEYLAKHGSATDSELRAVMGLRAGQYPSGYLATAIKAGKCNKDGKEWKLGPGNGIKQMKPFNSPQFGKSQAETKPEPVHETTPSVPNGYGQILPEPYAAAPVLALRCGIWSDGVVELQRGGSPIAFLSEEEASFMAQFMTRMQSEMQEADAT